MTVEPGVLQQLRRAAGGDQLDAERCEAAREFDEAGLVETLRSAVLIRPCMVSDERQAAIGKLGAPAYRLQLIARRS